MCGHSLSTLSDKAKKVSGEPANLQMLPGLVDSPRRRAVSLVLAEHVVDEHDLGELHRQVVLGRAGFHLKVSRVTFQN